MVNDTHTRRRRRLRNKPQPRRGLSRLSISYFRVNILYVSIISPRIVLWCNVGSLHALSLSRTRKRELRCQNIISRIDKALHLTHHHTKRDCSLRLLHVRTRYCVSLLLRVTVVAYKCWFLLRDAMQARPMASCGVCPSVCLSASHVRGFCLKAAFHYSCRCKPGRKQVESMLKASCELA